MFVYPIISNILATKQHNAIITEYQNTVNELAIDNKEDMKEIASKHNENLHEEPLDFIDPFENGEINSGNKNYYDSLDVGPSLGTLDIPGIGVNLPIYHGTNEEALSKGVGHLENSSLPTGDKGTHSVLTAHRGLPSSKLFRNINDVEVGEEFQIQVLDEIMTYKVFEIDIVLPDETDWLQNEEDKSLVTLLSCEPYMIDTHRLLVHGELIGIEKATDTPIGVKLSNSDLFNLVLMIVSITGVVIVLILLRRKQPLSEAK